MSRTKQTSKRKRRSKAVPVLGAAGLSLTLPSEASLANSVALDTMTRDAGVIHEITLREEALFDVSLATFHVFDKEGAKVFRAGERPITIGQGCCLFACLAGQAASENNAYSLSAPRPIRPARSEKALTVLLENWIDEAEQRLWFLFEATRVKGE
jgi:hypothetical protein